jgi:hypothetical protein
VERFTETLRDLFPGVTADPEEALVVAESMMMLHRRLERAIRRDGPPTEGATEQPKGKWPFRR